MSTLDALLANKQVFPIFRGKVVHVETVDRGVIVEFEVHRVWKGFLGTRFIIHQVVEPNPLGSKRQEGQEMFIVAYRQSPRERETMGIAADAPATYSSDCLSYPWSAAEHVQQILKGDPGYRPR
jgi:hypothetical protein